MDRRGIHRAVEEGRYEEALGVCFEATVTEIQRAHIRRLSKHSACVQTRELINFAKVRLTGETRIEKGRRLVRIGQKDLAVRFLTEALRNGDGEADDYLLTGQTLEQLSRLEQALDYYEKATRLRGEAGDFLWLGMALEHMSRFRAAEAAYRQAVEVRGEAVDYLAKGRLLLKKGRLEESRTCLEIAFKLGEKESALELLQQLRAFESKARIKRVIQSISQMLGGKG